MLAVYLVIVQLSLVGPSDRRHWRLGAQIPDREAPCTTMNIVKDSQRRGTIDMHASQIECRIWYVPYSSMVVTSPRTPPKSDTASCTGMLHLHMSHVTCHTSTRNTTSKGSDASKIVHQYKSIVWYLPLRPTPAGTPRISARCRLC